MAVQIKVRLQSTCQSESGYCNVNGIMRGCVHLLSPGAGGAVCLWHPWSTGSVRVPPRCRCSARLRLESNCTPATPPLAGWSAFRSTGTVVSTKATCLHTGTLDSLHHGDVPVMKLQHWTAMYSHSYPCGLLLSPPCAPVTPTQNHSNDLSEHAAAAARRLHYICGHWISYHMRNCVFLGFFSQGLHRTSCRAMQIKLICGCFPHFLVQWICSTALVRKA